MAVDRIAIVSPREASNPAAIRAAFAELFSMLIFVFAGQGSGMAYIVGYCGRQTYRQWTCNSWWSFSCIIVSCIWAFVAVAVGANIYGGHINPAVTFGAFIGGNITLLRSSAPLPSRLSTLNEELDMVLVTLPTIGSIVGANILVGGAFDGASMDPAVSFGPAVVSWSWTHHWVYWLGPFIGSAAAAILYDNIFIGDDGQEPLTNSDF
ncbi:hypothetical protein JHK84_055860 [Glycine max]|nr:hypothetical protein JHK84_055860 [Glycine max]